MAHVIVMILAVIGGMTVAVTIGFLIYIEIDSRREKERENSHTFISNNVDGDQHNVFNIGHGENGGHDEDV